MVVSCQGGMVDAYQVIVCNGLSRCGRLVLVGGSSGFGIQLWYI